VITTTSEQATAKVQPGQKSKRGSAGRGAKVRRAEARAKARADEVQRLKDDIKSASRKREHAWRAGEQLDEFGVARRDGQLKRLYGDKAKLRADLGGAPATRELVSSLYDEKPGRHPRLLGKDRDAPRTGTG